MKRVNNHAILFLILLFFSVTLSACITSQQYASNNDLPFLTQDELNRPYTKLARIQVTREMYGSDYILSPDITAWGFAALRHEAQKMGADAVMLPEVIGRTTSYGIIPSTEYRATGFAIKFR